MPAQAYSFMSSLADLPELVGFFSYSRRDDEHSDKALSSLRKRIYSELRVQLGRELRLWQDTVGIPLGTRWESQIKKAIAESAFFIPIVTPSAVNSKYCRMEFEAFLARERELHRDDLVFPILYIPVPGLVTADHLGEDEVLKIIHARQCANWTEIRLKDAASPEVKAEVARFCKDIIEALRRAWELPEERRRKAEVAARSQAEAAARSGEPGDGTSAPATPNSSTVRPWRLSRRALAGAGGLCVICIGLVLGWFVMPRPMPPVSTDAPLADTLASQRPGIQGEPAATAKPPASQQAAIVVSPVAPNGPSVDAAGKCPPDEDLQRLNPEIDGSVASQRRRTGSPVGPDLPLYRNSALTGLRVEKAPSGYYDDDVVVMVGARLGTTGPALVRRIRDNVCGWMDVRDLEKSSEPLKLIQLPGFGNERDGLGLPNRFDARVVVMNRIDQQTGNPQRAPIFHAPFDGPEPPEAEWRSSVAYYEVLSVYEGRRKNGPCRSVSEEGCFLRVGTTNEYGSGHETRYRGWMLAKDLAVWPSPLAVYYKPGTEGLKIHATEPSARNGTPYAGGGVKTMLLALQPQGPYKEPRDANIMRFPVIQ